MTVTVANVDQTTDTFGGFISKTNQIATALSTVVVSTNSNTAVGNAAVSNAFGANVLYANTVSGGNTSGSANLTVSSNLVINPYGGNVVVVLGNSSTGSYQTTISGNSVTISPANTTISGTRLTVSVSNVIVTANTKVTGNTSLYGNSSILAVEVTGNSIATNVNIVADTAKITGITKFTGNSNIQANSTLNNILVTGNGTISNVNITANDVYLTPSSNVNITSALNITNTTASGNTTVTGFVNASASVNSAIISVGTDFIANTTGAYHTGTINALSYTTTNFQANNTGVYPLSNSAGVALGSTTKRWSLNANTINASGLITGTNGLDITGTANASVAIYIGANNYSNTTASVIQSNSTVNTVITATSLTQSNTTATTLSANDSGIFHTGQINAASHTTSGVTANTTGVYPTSNSTGTSLGGSTRRWVITANTIDTTGLITSTGGVDVTGTTNTTNLYVGTNVLANSSGIVPASNSSGTALGNSTARWIINANTINATGTAALGNTTVTGFANISSSLQVAGNTTLNGNLTLGSAAFIANGSPGAAGQFLLSNGTTAYWETITNLNVVNTQFAYVFSNVITLDRSGSTGDNELLVKSQNTSAITIQGDSLNTANSTNSGAYLRIGVDGTANIAILSVIQEAGNNGIGGSYTDSLAGAVLLGSIGTKPLQLGTANAVTATITSGGNTGLGNTAPAHKLRVEGTFSALTSIQVNSEFLANTTGAYHSGLINAASFNTTGVTANVTGVYPTSNSSGTDLGSTTRRWAIYGNTINLSSNVAIGSNVFINTSTFFVGNSTVNTNISAGTINVNGAIIANNSGIVPGSNTTGVTFGSSTARWVITANTVDASGNVSAGGFTYSNGASVGIIVYNYLGVQVFP